MSPEPAVTAAGGGDTAPGAMSPASAARGRSYAARIVAAATARPDAVAVVDPQGRISGADFAAQVLRLARALARHGVDTGRRLAVVAPPTAAAPALRYAAGLLGAATVLVPRDAAAEDVAAITTASEADLLAVWPATAPGATVAMRASGIRLVLSMGPVCGADVDLAATAAGEAPEPVADRADVAAAAVLLLVGGGRTPTVHTFGQWLDRVESGAGVSTWERFDRALLLGTAPARVPGTEPPRQ